jgi:hypothetical protein
MVNIGWETLGKDAALTASSIIKQLVAVDLIVSAAFFFSSVKIDASLRNMHKLVKSVRNGYPGAAG